MLRVETVGPVCTIALARPEVRNAINDELISGLAAAFERIPDSVRAIVLSGDGEAFCAGGDLQWMRRAAGYTQEQNYSDALELPRLFAAMRNCPAVIIARVQGAAFGGGSGLVAAADVGIASETAIFAFSEVKLGLVAATISPVVIGKIGPGHTRALFVTGARFNAERALRIGLVHEVVTPGELDAAVAKTVQQVLSSGPRAVATSKRLTYAPPLTPEESARTLAEARSGDEGREGVSAFLEKRAASFVVKP